jgi:hypothetical protein
MSAYTTLRITRTRALQEMLGVLLTDTTDEELAEFMDKILARSLYNCIIVPDHDKDNDDDRL